MERKGGVSRAVSASLVLILLILVANLAFSVLIFARYLKLRDEQSSQREVITEHNLKLNLLIRKLSEAGKSEAESEQEILLDRERRGIKEGGDVDTEQALQDLDTLSLTDLSFLRGPPGKPGRDGRDGPVGPTGLQGEPGNRGLPGPQGPPGVAGPPGRDGRDGARGLVGPRGEKGESGDYVAGPKGDKGSGGFPGRKGANGEKGVRGEAVVGAKGDKGAKGEIGASGSSSSGSTGSGRSGPKGQKGEMGHAGVKGEAGLSGRSGSAGNLSAIHASIHSIQTRLSEVENSVNSSSVPSILTKNRTTCTQEVMDLGWPTIVSKGKCYVLGTTPRSWSSAESFCRSLGYHLVTFNDAVEQSLIDRWLLNELGRPSHEEIWTAGHKVGSSWKWSMPDAEMNMIFTDWASGEPSFNDDCISLDNRVWYGRRCTSNYDYVCEGPADVETVQESYRGGEVYTHWGRNQCNDKSTTLYTGIVGGAKYSVPGGGVNFQCLPPDPELHPFNTNARSASNMTSVEYESQDYGIFPDNIDNKHAVCARCYTENRPTVYMIPAKKTCPTGWTLEYDGFMMAAKHDEAHPSTYECVDVAPEYTTIPPADMGGRLWFVNVDCSGGGSVGSCDKYVDGKQLTCVVCSK